MAKQYTRKHRWESIIVRSTVQMKLAVEGIWQFNSLNDKWNVSQSLENKKIGYRSHMARGYSYLTTSKNSNAATSVH